MALGAPPGRGLRHHLVGFETQIGEAVALGRLVSERAAVHLVRRHDGTAHRRAHDWNGPERLGQRCGGWHRHLARARVGGSASAAAAPAASGAAAARATSAAAREVATLDAVQLFAQLLRFFAGALHVLAHVLIDAAAALLLRHLAGDVRQLAGELVQRPDSILETAVHVAGGARLEGLLQQAVETVQITGVDPDV